ncbi:hypothetical protein [Sporosarcina cyprini]|uniref:hypothetical protein n=1 Tax=Sporosarcina cyprini TaxID=2910523 RepID=UPI001EDFC3C4|nr:hypothetical protein [Sporosarcina cyprini]MCG3086663.1 hypothetical protein [Sporosarcina cyprini]
MWKLRYVTIFIVAMAIFFSLKVFNEYRERNLVDVMRYKSSDFYALGVIKDVNEVPKDKGYEWYTKDKEPVNELLEYLGSYRVKKIKEEEFTANQYQGERFEFTITHAKSNPSIVWIGANHVQVLVGNYYEVVNGPIDMEWIEEFNEKYKESYREY